MRISDWSSDVCSSDLRLLRTNRNGKRTRMSDLLSTGWFWLVAGYLLGSVPFGLLLTAAAGGGALSKIGSGNIGTTNVLRTGRQGLAAATLLLAAGRGAVIAVGRTSGGERWVKSGQTQDVAV